MVEVSKQSFGWSPGSACIVCGVLEKTVAAMVEALAEHGAG